jgi:outer membrane protein assembly factor BamB
MSPVAHAEGIFTDTAPAGMEMEWQSATSGGAATRAWVKDDLVLTVSGNTLTAINRADGFHKWNCALDGEIKFAPSVSRANVLVNVNNYLIAIDKRGGNVRWKLGTDFIMSAEPVLIDPPLYPSEYTREWQNLESIYVPGWDSRLHAYWSRGRLATLIKGFRREDDVIAPTYDLFKQWLKANRNGAFTLMPVRLRDNMLYYTADNNYVYAISRDGEEQEPYFMMGPACTDITTTAGSLYVGSRDGFVYCLDRLTMRKRWSMSPGSQSRGTIFADEPQTPLVYIPLEEGNVQAMRISPARVPAKGGPEIPERITEFWKVKGEGTVSAGPLFVYIGDGKVGDRAYKSVSAVDKSTGKIVWTLSSAAQYLEYQNNWSNRDSGARIYALNADGRVVSYKEKRRDTGVQIAVMPKEAEPEQFKVPVTKKKDETSAEPPTPPKPDDKKPDEKKPDDAKPDEKKPDDKKPDDKKPDAPKAEK